MDDRGGWWFPSKLPPRRQALGPAGELAGDWPVARCTRAQRLSLGRGYEDYLVGVIFVISGDSKLMDELFIRLP
jgi:hypothetical protein